MLSTIVEKEEENKKKDDNKSASNSDSESEKSKEEKETEKAKPKAEEPEEEDLLKKQLLLSKRCSVDTLGLLNAFKKKEDNPFKLDETAALYEIKEEYEDNKEKDKEEENGKEKEKEDMKVKAKEEDPKMLLRPGSTIPPAIKGLKKNKTDGILPVFGRDSKAAEDRRDRMAKRLNRAKQVAKNNEQKNKYRKSIDITMKASLLQHQLSDLMEDKKDK